MSVSFNKVIVCGNVTRDPQVRFLANEKAVAEFGMAINRKWKSEAGEAKEEVTFLELKAWGRTAETIGKYVTKGKSILVEGRIQQENWTDKESGKPRSKLVIVADYVQFLSAPEHRSDASAANDDDARAPVADTPPRSRPSIPAGGGDFGYDDPPFTRSDLELMA